MKAKHGKDLPIGASMIRNRKKCFVNNNREKNKQKPVDDDHK